jgi:hypothetical protein
MSKYLGPNFGIDVRALLLTGLSTATSAVITAADSVLGALGKLQAQITLRAPLASPTFTGTISGTADFSSVSVRPNSSATLRALSLSLDESVNVKDFGATGNGVTDDTTAMRAALAYAISNKKPLWIPPGNYLTDTLTYGSVAYASQVPIIGAGRNVTKLSKKSSDGLALLIIGASSATNFTASVKLVGFTLQGIGANTAAALRTYDLVRSEIDDVAMTTSIIGWDCKGGIGSVARRCLFDSNQVGAELDKFTSLASGGYPNLMRIEHSVFTGNSSRAIHFDNGRHLTVHGCDIEDCGTAADSSTMGIFIGPNIGSDEAPGTITRGAIIEDCWFEQNHGDADIQVNGGINVMSRCYFVNNAGTTYDIRIDAARYHVLNCSGETVKTPNIGETLASLSGNFIFGSSFPNISFNVAKTITHNGSEIFSRSGSVPIVPVLSKPQVLVGLASLSGGGATVVFSPTFAATPFVTLSQANNSPTTVESLEYYNLTSSGFSIRCKALTSGSTTVSSSSPSVSWIAIGAT